MEPQELIDVLTETGLLRRLDAILLCLKWLVGYSLYRAWWYAKNQREFY